MASSDDTAGDDPEAAVEQVEADETSASDQPEAADEVAGSEDAPEIDPDEQANVPSALADIDPAEVEAEAGADAGDETDDHADGEQEIEGDSDAMAPDVGGDSPVQAGEMYVSLVQSVSNSQVRKFGGPDAEELDRDHFEQYDLADHFNATMDEMGVGSDLDPHEALLLATVLSVGEGLVSETDVLDQQIDRLMGKAMGGDGGASA